MKKSQFIKEEEISFEELSENWVSLKFGNDRFVMDTDTLIDLSFRCASFLAYLEGKEQNSISENLEACNCISADKNLLH
ncbi:hypothetical protein [Bdellovibrio sp. HCB337]|uniref:hypothetical protein n=1 Tax=Bdellovibrio sp. HCB337 TaxID=3394358 RepID=UPI0039A54410